MSHSLAKPKRTHKSYDRQAANWLGNRGIPVPGEEYKQVLWLSDDSIAAQLRESGEWDIYFTVGLVAEPYDGVIVPPKIETTLRRYLCEQAVALKRDSEKYIR